MTEKKFTKTYFSLPDKRNQIDIAIGNRYKNIDVLVNGSVVVSFPDTDALNQSTEINTPDGHTLHVRFFQETSDFEVVFDGIQVDDSHTSPRRVIGQVRMPIIIALCWYAVALLLSGKLGLNIPAMVAMSPSMLLTHPVVIYLMTSTIVVLIVLILGILKIHKGSLILYKVIFITVLADMIYGLIYYLYLLTVLSNDFHALVITELFVPLVVKSGVLFIMVRNWPKFKRFSNMLPASQRLFSPELVDQL